MKSQLDYCEFYITNVCNLNCPRCNRFNNYAFAGHQRWSEYSDVYRRWSQRLEINRIGIMGGEPLLNPDLEHWIHGLAELWPDANIFIITNGTQLKKQQSLFDILKHYQGRVRIDIHRHDPSHWELLQRDVETFYRDGYEKFVINHRTKPKTGICQSQGSTSAWTQESTPAMIWNDPLYEIVYRDKSDIVIRLSHSNNFDNVALVFDPVENQLKLPYLNDPDLAIQACSSKWSHHLSQGRLYKCRMTAVLPEFVKQFPVQMTPEQRSIVNTSQGLEADCNDQDLALFIANLVNCHSVEQCRLCPASFDTETFSAGSKKIRIEKLLDRSF